MWLSRLLHSKFFLNVDSSCVWNNTVWHSLALHNINKKPSRGWCHECVKLFWFWLIAGSTPAAIWPWVKVSPIKATRPEGCRTLDVSMLKSKKRSRTLSDCEAMVLRLRLTVAKPWFTNSRVSSLKSESLVYSFMLVNAFTKYNITLSPLIKYDVLLSFHQEIIFITSI